MLNVVAGLALAVFAAENAPAAPAQGTPEPLAEELRAADQKYRRKLDGILRLAEIQDDNSVRTDVKRRQAVTAKYQSVGMPRVERTLTIRGSFSGDPTLAVYDGSIGWSGGTYPSHLTANGQIWGKPRENLAVAIEEIVRWKSTGKITVRLSTSETTCTRLLSIETNIQSNTSTFVTGEVAEQAMLQIVYRTPKDRDTPDSLPKSLKEAPAVPARIPPASLAEKLRAADREYRAKLEEILRRAEKEDDKAVKADVNQRQATTAQYESSVEVPKSMERKLTITGDMLGKCNLVVDDDRIHWDGFFWLSGPETLSSGPSLLTANGQVWTRMASLPVRMKEIVGWKSAGNVRVHPMTDATGAQLYQIVSQGRGSERGVPFMLQFVYRTGPATQPVPKKERKQEGKKEQ